MKNHIEKKYEFTDETMEFEGHTLKRIRLLPNNLFYIKGKVGGWIESEANLSHEDDCFVEDEAKVFGNARVEGDVVVENNAIVKDNALIKGECCICNQAIVGADTILTDNAWIRDTSKVFFYAQAIDGNNDDESHLRPHISGDTHITGDSIIEATGSIKDSELHNVSLFGILNMNNERI